MKLLGNHEIVFNGVNLHDLGYDCVAADTVSHPVFGAGKNITKSAALNALRYTRNRVTRQPLTIKLSLIKLRGNTEWTWEDIDRLYRVLDVTDYAKLYFHSLNQTSGYKAYYNAIPFIGGETELLLFANNNGYVDITFETDSGNAWVDIEQVFVQNTAADFKKLWVLDIPNIANVKQADGSYSVFPYVKIEFFDNCEYCSFSGAKTVDNSDEWVDLYLNLAEHPEWKGCTLELDGENRQYSISYTENGVKRYGDPSDVWDICTGSLRFLELKGGEVNIYHRELLGTSEQANLPYRVTIKAAYPVNIGGLLIDD